jgi:branched-chain amino acid transport system permease protein
MIRKTFLIGGFVFCFFLLVPFLFREYYVNVIIEILFMIYLGSCWNILGGFAGLHSFGHVLFVGVGAYVSTCLFMFLGISPWIGMFLGAILASLLALGIGYLSFRYGLIGIFFALVSLAFAEAFYYLVSAVDALGGMWGIWITMLGNNPLQFQFKEKSVFYYIILFMALLVLLLSNWIKNRRFGYYLIAIRENENAAEALGINILKYKLLAIMLSAFMSALAGTFYAQYILYIDPPSFLGMDLSVAMMVNVVVGGIGTVIGPVLGPFILYPVSEVTRILLGGKAAGSNLMIYSLILILVVMYMPDGIWGFIQKVVKNRNRK